MTITREQANDIARRFLEAQIAPRVSYEPVITSLHEYEHSWVATYNTRAFVETGEPKYMLAGNGPLIINRQSGLLRRGVSRKAVEDQLDSE